MSAQFDSFEMEDLLKEVNRLTLENKKINRQLTLARNAIDKLRNVAIAQETVKVLISSEKLKQEKYLQVIIDNSPDIIIILDSSAKFVLYTKSFLKLAQVPSIEPLYNKSFKETLSQRFDEEWLEHMEGAFINALESQEFYSSNERIGALDYMVSAAPFKCEPLLGGGVLVVFKDLTDIVSARDQAKAASEAKSNFLATMSHEIRTPMNAIIGMANMMEKTELDERQIFLSNNIKNSSMALLGLVNDILDFSKIEAGKLEIVEDYFDVRSAVKHLESVFEVLFSQNGLRFQVSISPDVPEVISGDENRLKQILTNLLSNTLKYTKDGYVSLSVSCPDRDSIQFGVEDTGIGIKEEDLKKLFTPFEQFDKAANKNVVGTGLGLAITSKLCEMMNGSIRVRSVYGKGSAFSITLPLVRGESSKLKNSSGDCVNFTAPGANVLVVDDIDVNLIVAEAMLIEYGINVTLAEDGLKAIELARENEFDIIFMDHMMPEIDGIETAARLRRMGGYLARVPIIALTANATTEAQNMFAQNGMNGLVPKPIDHIQLNHCLLKWLPEDKIEAGAAS